VTTSPPPTGTRKPTPTAQELVDAFCTPGPLPPPRRRDLAVLDGGMRFSVPGPDGPLAAWSFGDGPVVLLAHGWGSRAAHLAAFVAPLLASGCRVLSVDLPGHGMSGDGLSDGYRFQQGIAALAAAASPQRRVAAVVAHSLSTMATTMALAAAGRDDGIEAERVAVVAGSARLTATAERWCAARGLDDGERETFRSGMAERFGSDLWDRTDGEVLAVGLSNVAALVVHDRRDEEVGLAEAERLAAAWPGARLLVTDGLGHRRILRHVPTAAAVAAFVAAS